MKVCIVSLNIVPLFDPTRGNHFGGAEVQASFVADALRASGQHVSLVVSDLSDPHVIPYHTENAFDSTEGIPGLRFFHPRWTGVMRALERADADIYFQHCAGMITGLTAMFCRRASKVFVYGAGSDMDFAMRRGGVRGLRDSVMFSYGLSASQGLVVQNERQRTAAARRFAKPTRVIPTGTPLLNPENHSHGDAVVWIGAMWRVKRPELFLELARRMPDRHFLVIGSAGELDARIRAEAKQIPNLEMLGRMSRDEVSKVLRRSALLVNTSSVEGFPNAFLEAWNHGVPVVAFNDVDGIIRDAGVGAVCSTIDEMVVAIRDLTGDRTRLHPVRERARRLVRERFSSQVLGPQYVEFFEELLAAKHAARAPLGVSAGGV
jgi:glycosyltransferase involved in cell wall biosynthesis